MDDRQSAEDPPARPSAPVIDFQGCRVALPPGAVGAVVQRDGDPPVFVKALPIPSLGFARGVVVRRHGTGPNMLVVRGFGPITAVVVIEGDQDGALRLREVPTADLVQILGHD